MLHISFMCCSLNVQCVTFGLIVSEVATLRLQTLLSLPVNYGGLDVHLDLGPGCFSQAEALGLEEEELPAALTDSASSLHSPERDPRGGGSTPAPT